MERYLGYGFGGQGYRRRTPQLPQIRGKLVPQCNGKKSTEKPKEIDISHS